MSFYESIMICVAMLVFAAGAVGIGGIINGFIRS